MADQVARDKRAGGIVNKDLGRRVAAHSLDANPAGVLAGRTADHRTWNIEARNGFGEHGLLSLADDRLHIGNARMIQKCLECPPDDRLSADELVLLRFFASRPQSGTPGHDHRRYCHNVALARPGRARKNGP